MTSSSGTVSAAARQRAGRRPSLIVLPAPSPAVARRLGALAGVCVVLALLVGAGTASAHLRSGTVAVDYRASIFRRVTAAYSAEIYQSDHGLTLTRRSGHVVVLLGYLGEPVFRLDAAGLWVNDASLTAAALHLVPKGQAVTAPTPRWRLQRGRRTVVWHDARVQGLPPGVDHGVWTVPLIVDGRRASLQGGLRRYPAPPLWAWFAVLAVWLTAGGTALRRRDRDLVRPAAIGFAYIAAAATTVVVLAFAFDAYASPGTWIEGLDAIAFIAVGVGILLRGPRNLHVAAAIWVGLIAVAVALLEGPIFLHPVVLAVLPGTVMRILVTAALGAGVNASVLGALRFSEITDAVRDAGPTFGLTPPDGGGSEPARRDAFGA
jgi:hypothetical protein